MTQMPAGWYPDPELEDTQRYWDGAGWTESRGPSPEATAPIVIASGPSTGKIAAGVALGVGGVIGIVWIISSISHANDATDCTFDNLDRAQQGQTLLDCPDP